VHWTVGCEVFLELTEEKKNKFQPGEGKSLPTSKLGARLAHTTLVRNLQGVLNEFN